MAMLLVGCRTTTNEPAVALTPETLAAPTPPQHEVDIQRLAALGKLEKPISLNNDAFTLDMVIHYVRDATHSNIAVNWASLALVEVTPDTPVPMSLENVKASEVLRLALEHASADLFDDDKLTYVVRNGIVEIATRRLLNQTTELRSYSIDEFANTRPSINKRIYGRNNDARRMLGMTTLQNKTIDPQQVEAQNLNQGFCATCDASRKHDRLEFALQLFTYQEQVDQIVELITTTVGDPDEWLDEESTLTEINGSLLIKTTPENHAQIRTLFESMRLEQAQRFKRQALEMEVFLLLEAAEADRLEQNYHAALNTIHHALRVDPNSLEAKALKDIVTATLSR